MSRIYQPISLGSTCEAKFQICRKLYSTFYGKKSEAGFRMQMMPPERGEKYYGWHAFDWQRTPFSALLAHLEGDFDRTLEREDLYIEGEFIYHRIHGTEHSHQFPGFSLQWTNADLDRAHAHVQRHLEKRVVGFRDLLRSPGPYLYVWTASYYAGTDHLPPVGQVRRLLELLSASSPAHDFHLLMVGNPGKDADYSELGERVSTALRLEDSLKSPAMAWEGNDASWDAILAPFTLAMHDRAPPAQTPTQVAASERRPLLARLRGR